MKTIFGDGIDLGGGGGMHGSSYVCVNASMHARGRGAFQCHPFPPPTAIPLIMVHFRLENPPLL